MTETTQNAINALQALRLPELRTRYALVVGEETKCPNKTWLVRKITEALAAKNAEAGVAEPPALPQVEHGHQGVQKPLEDLAVPNAPPATPKLTKMSVEALQARYAEVVGRPTGSTNASYVEPADMWSCGAGRPGRTRRAAPTTPHIGGLVGGARARCPARRTSLSFSPHNACMPSRGGMVPPATTRGEQA